MALIVFPVIFARLMSHNVPFLLYADDDPDDIELLELNLRKVSPSVDLRAFASAKSAIQFLDRSPDGAALPAVIIFDFNMPGWNGLQALEAIKRSPVYSAIPVYIFTTSDHPRLKAQALELGAEDMITKPFDADGLMAVCKRFLVHTQNAPGD